MDSEKIGNYRMLMKSIFVSHVLQNTHLTDVQNNCIRQACPFSGQFRPTQFAYNGTGFAIDLRSSGIFDDLKLPTKRGSVFLDILTLLWSTDAHASAKIFFDGGSSGAASEGWFAAWSMEWHHAG